MAAMMLVFASPDAHALALGRVIVQSALGEPLRAEIDIPEINADEAASLRTVIASPEAFKAAGLEYSAIMPTLQISLQRRADGRSFLRLTSDRAMNDPFVDLILEASWSSGRIVRDYTMLFDPANLRTAPVEVTAAPQVTQAAPAVALPAQAVPAARPPVASPPAAPAAVARPPVRPAAPGPTPTPAQATARAASPAPAPAPVREPATSGRKVVVKSGDTASRIAGSVKPASVSLDQMLVALLRSNPDAFIAGNINRLKSGAVLDLPAPEQAAGISPTEASQTVLAQSKDFNEFRRRLAEGLPTTVAAAPDRKAAGKLEARVEDRKTAAAAPDKLTLSKGAVQGKDASVAAQDALAKQREAKDAAARVAELSRNISELSKLAAAAPAATTASAPKAGVNVAAGAPAVAAAASAATASPAPVVVASAAKPAASAPAVAAPVAPPAVAPAAKPPAPVVKASAPAPVETSLVDDLLDNPFVLPGAGLLVAAMGGFAFWRSRQRKKAAQVDSSFLESRLQPDSFFGASGGQRVDTNDGSGATGSSMVYSPSQLDAAGDVDPVAEADVYLAYGRDLQAEEILKEAMRTNPSRVAIYTKLAEIYAKRRDGKALEAIAVETYNLTRGKGPDWSHVCDLGRDLDPSNPLYLPGGAPVTASQLVDSEGPDVFGSTTAPMPLSPDLPPAPAAPVDFDLDLDFSTAEEAPSAGGGDVGSIDLDLMDDEPSLKTQTMNAIAEPAPDAMQPLDMDFGLDLPTAAPPSQSFATETVKLSAPDMAMASNGLSFSPEPLPLPTPDPVPMPVMPDEPPAVSAAPALDEGMIEFDLDSLSLDLDLPPAKNAGLDIKTPELDTMAPSLEFEPEEELLDIQDPLATKLALAEEFQAIGDTDGARALIQEVADEATGAVKAKAQRLLSEMA
jgi:pilus assembly protein FimV